MALVGSSPQKNKRTNTLIAANGKRRFEPTRHHIPMECMEKTVCSGKHDFPGLMLRSPAGHDGCTDLPGNDIQDGRSQEVPNDQAILCANCRAQITRHQMGMAVNGRHEHAFFNPAGIAFEIRCFRQAPGVMTEGPSSAAFTWFPGYLWQIALCTTCHAHLGWQFTNSTSFFGLIATRLA